MFRGPAPIAKNPYINRTEYGSAAASDEHRYMRGSAGTQGANRTQGTGFRLNELIKVNSRGSESALPKASDFATAGCGNVSDYTFQKQLGHGAYAVVKQATHRTSSEKRAIKMYERYKLVDSTRRQSLIREIRILAKLSHPNIVGFFEAIDTSKYV